VETLPTVTEFEVTPVWSLKALAGILDDAEVVLLPPAEVVVVVDVELFELHAIAVVANRSVAPSAASRAFRVVPVMLPPSCRTPGPAYDSPTGAGVMSE
jgi:hypothetical protein